MLSPIIAEERAARMSGVLALLDDVAAIAKVAAASVDDVVGQAAKAGGKAAGAVIDDAAVTPKYVHGFAAERELPIVWKIARGSIFNKMVILLPAALILSAFAPWAIAPLLMLGGLYLCFEGAEKVSHWLSARHNDLAEATARKMSGAHSAHLEERKVRGAVKTDFILSAEIMTIALAAIETDSVLLEALALAVAGIGVTVLVYGSVALIVKADDMGLYLARTGGTEALRGPAGRRPCAVSAGRSCAACPCFSGG
jgi:predicted DNA repair protein MutK